MKSRLFFLITAMLSVAVSVSADTVLFRSGKVLAAELTTQKIDVSGFPAEKPLQLPKDPVYAVVTFQLAPGRAISVFDYELVACGTGFPCVAINHNGQFVMRDTALVSSTPVQLLFITDRLAAGNEEKELHHLRSRFKPSNIYSTPLIFTNLKSDSPKTVSEIPADGCFTPAVKSDAPAAKPQESQAPTGAAE